MWPFSHGSGDDKPNATKVETVDAREAYARATRGARLIDVRSEGEFKAGHPQGARNVPPARLDVQAARWSHDDEILVICLSGSRSRREARNLARMGFTNVSNVAGGLHAWQQAGLPVRR
jgi:rhodanese-related sulfurtransferase